MGRGDGYASFEGEDDGDASVFDERQPSIAPSLENLAREGPGAARRHSRGGMTARPGRANASRGRARSSGSKKLRFDPRSLREAAGSMLTVAVLGVVACAAILYITFFQAAVPQFYGALVVSMIVMFLLCYVAARLLGAER